MRPGTDPSVVAGSGGPCSPNVCKKIRAEGRADKITFLAGQLPDSVYRLAAQWLEALGSNRLMTYEPFGFEALRQANQVCFQQASIPTHDLTKARFLIGLGTIFWRRGTPRHTMPGHSARCGVQRRRGNSSRSNPACRSPGRMRTNGLRSSRGGKPFSRWGCASDSPNSAVPAEEKARFSQLLEPYSPEQVASVTEVPVETITRLAQGFVSHGPSLALGGGIATSSRQETASLVAVNLLNYIAAISARPSIFMRPKSGLRPARTRRCYP